MGYVLRARGGWFERHARIPCTNQTCVRYWHSSCHSCIRTASEQKGAYEGEVIWTVMVCVRTRVYPGSGKYLLHSGKLQPTFGRTASLSLKTNKIHCTQAPYISRHISVCLCRCLCLSLSPSLSPLA